MGRITDKIIAQEADAAIDSVALEFKNTKERMYRTLDSAKNFGAEITALKQRANAAGGDAEDMALIDSMYETIRGGAQEILDGLPENVKVSVDGL